ncbi:MAG: MazG family protein [Christensenellaceae bacterium]|jgi:tetrapyrrole methylase family protein/MazG family protein|nr:MazG family protein [Christensenellaceae bacterium]
MKNTKVLKKRLRILDSYVFLNAMDFVLDGSIQIDRKRALFIVNVPDGLEKEVLIKLLHYYDGTFMVDVFLNDGTIEYTRLDNVTIFDHMCLFSSNFLERKHFGFNDLIEIMRKLRGPNGCPWDKEQTHETIRKNALEEAYELVEAIDLKDNAKICEESGDVLLQSIFHALIAETNKEFTIEDMLNGLCKKLISRHTHIFGENKANTSEEALGFWEQAKSREKKATDIKKKIENIPSTLPALMKAEKIIKILNNEKKVDFDPISDMDSIKFANDLIGNFGSDNIKEKLGLYLFSLVKLAIDYNIDLENSLTETINSLVKKMDDQGIIKPDRVD